MRSLTILSSYTDSSIPSALYGKTKSKWATSPAETYSNLQLLNKPIAYGVIDVVRNDLVESERVLVEGLQAPCENMGIITG